MPLRRHEDIVVFYKALPTYNPQMVKCGKHQRNHSRGNKPNKTNRCYGQIHDVPFVVSDEKFPTSIISISQIVGKKTIHPTQKPVSLLEYLVKTYSNPNELVLDNTMGSGSTGIACINTNRKFIGIEKDKKYFKLAYKRIKEHNKPLFG